jgi:hypothetical protein
MQRQTIAFGIVFVSAFGFSPAPPLQAAEAPLRVALLVDTSGSIRPADQAIRNKLAADIARGLPEGSEVALFAFDDKPRLLVPRTTKVADVADAVAKLGAAGHFTALNDAIFDGAKEIGASGTGRRAIVILTDGLDENSALVPEDGVNEARQQRMPIVAVGVGSVQEKYLRRIAKLSGGEYFAPGVTAAAVVAKVKELAPLSEGRPARAMAAESAPAPDAALVAKPAALAVAAPTSQTWPILAALAAAVAIALAALGFALLKRPTLSEAPARDDSPAEVPSDVLEPDQGGDDDQTLISRLTNVGDEGQTLVLTLKPLLHVTRGPNVGKFFEVSIDRGTSIGRAKGNEVSLDDRAISSQHCRIRPQRGVYELIDLKSTNGTFVNERKIARTNLTAGDVIKVGESVMQFRMDHMKS